MSDSTPRRRKLVPLHSSFYNGRKFGKVTVLTFLFRNPKSKAVWSAICDCGKEFTVLLSGCLSGNTTSCGCNWKTSSPRTHGMSNTRVYKIWKDMRKRCTNPNTKSAKHYIGRGIGICSEWADFDTFYADMGDPPSKFSLDRIDNNQGYSKENCRWANQSSQMNNTRVNRVLTGFGKTQTLMQWSVEYGIHYGCLMARVNRGWSIERAVTEPPRVNQYV